MRTNSHHTLGCALFAFVFVCGFLHRLHSLYMPGATQIPLGYPCNKMSLTSSARLGSGPSHAKIRLFCPFSSLALMLAPFAMASLAASRLFVMHAFHNAVVASWLIVFVVVVLVDEHVFASVLVLLLLGRVCVTVLLVIVLSIFFSKRRYVRWLCYYVVKTYENCMCQ